MSVQRNLRYRFHQVFGSNASSDSLTPIPKRSAVADRQKAKEDKANYFKNREYRKNPVSELSNKKYLLRHGWGVGNIRKYGLLNQSKISGQWKLFFYTYRTKDQEIGCAAREGRPIDKLIDDRSKFSRAKPVTEFETRHISRDKPTFPKNLEIIANNINQVDGHEYQNKFLEKVGSATSEEIPNYVELIDPKLKPPLLGLLSDISRTLKRKIDAEPAAKNPRIPGKTPLATNYMLMLSFAIHSACKDEFNTTAAGKANQISQASIVGALNHLMTLPLLESVIIAKQHTDEADSAVRLAKRLAWRIAYKMAATPMGFDMLKKINKDTSEQQYTNPPLPPTIPPLPEDASEHEIAQVEATKKAAAEAAPEIARQNRINLRRDESLRLFMQGADAMLQQEDPQLLNNIDPASLLVFCRDTRRDSEPRSNSLLVNALPGLQRILATNELNTTDVSNTTDELKPGWTESVHAIPGLHSQLLWAANALRNGFLSNAGGTPFDKANKRLQKVAMQVIRGLRNQNHTDTTEINRLRTFEKEKAQSALPRIFKRNRGKSPFNRSVKIGIAANSVLLQREKMVAALRLLDKILSKKLPDGIIDDNGNFNGNAFNCMENRKFSLDKIAQIIYVRAWASTNISEILDGRPLSDGVANKLYTDKYLQDLMGLKDLPPVNARSNFHNLKELLKDIVKEPLTPTVIKGFFDDVDPATISNNAPAQGDRVEEETVLTKDIPDVQNINHMPLKQCLAAFDRAIKHLLNGSDPVTIGPDELLDRSAIATHLKNQTQRMRLASSIKFSDGAAIGIGISGLTAVVARVFMGGLFGVRANFSYRRSRIATVEIGVNTTSGFARFGTETNHTNRSGAGGSVGWSFAKLRNLVVGTGAYADGKLIYDPGKFTGVALRLDRLGADITGREGQIPGVAGDANMTVDLGEVVEQVINGSQTNHGLLRELLENRPQLSVCWVDEGDSTTRDSGHIAQGGVLVGAFANGVGVGSAASLARTRKHQEQDYEEQTGALRSRAIVRGDRTSVNGSATALGAVNLARISGEPIVANETVAIGEVLGADAEIYRDGKRAEIRTIEYQGQIQPRSFKLIIHANAEGFASSVEPNLQEWAQRFVQVKEPHNYFYDDNAPGENKMQRQLNATGEQAGIIVDMIKDIRENADPNTSYVEYLELEEATCIEINRYRHMATMAKLAGPQGEKEREILEEAAERLLNDPTSYVRRFLFTSTTRVADEGRQINLVGSFYSTTQVTETVMRDGYTG